MDLRKIETIRAQGIAFEQELIRLEFVKEGIISKRKDISNIDFDSSAEHNKLYVFFNDYFQKLSSELNPVFNTNIKIILSNVNEIAEEIPYELKSSLNTDEFQNMIYISYVLTRKNDGLNNNFIVNFNFLYEYHNYSYDGSIERINLKNFQIYLEFENSKFKEFRNFLNSKSLNLPDISEFKEKNKNSLMILCAKRQFLKMVDDKITANIYNGVIFHSYNNFYDVINNIKVTNNNSIELSNRLKNIENKIYEVKAKLREVRDNIVQLKFDFYFHNTNNTNYQYIVTFKDFKNLIPKYILSIERTSPNSIFFSRTYSDGTSYSDYAIDIQDLFYKESYLTHEQIELKNKGYLYNFNLSRFRGNNPTRQDKNIYKIMTGAEVDFICFENKDELVDFFEPLKVSIQQ